MRIFLLTHFAALLCLDTVTGQLVQQPLAAAPAPSRVPLALEPRGGAYAVTAAVPPGADTTLLGKLALASGAQPALLALHDGTGFLRAEPDGRIGMSPQNVMWWESFLPIAEPDAGHLSRLLAGWWQLGGAPLRCNLVGFDLVFGAESFSLAAQLPFGPVLTPAGLLLRGPQGDVAATRAPPPPPGIWLNPLGNIGNRALQYLTAAGIAAQVPGAGIHNIRLEMWGLDAPAPRPPFWASASTGGRYRLDTTGLADCLRRAVVETVIIDSYTFHVSHYPSRAESRRLLPPLAGVGELPHFGPHELVCSIRGGEIFAAIHPDYFPLPPGYYKTLQVESGLEPVFFGQLGDDAYTRSLRAAFPRARFIPGKNPAHDFEALRRAPNIALSISTFAWLGEAKCIYLPVGGMFSPVQHPDQLYIVENDPAYRYMLLPPVQAENLFTNPVRFFQAQDYIAAQTRLAGAAEVAALCRRAERLGQGMARVSGFDRSFYQALYPDAAAELRDHGLTALEHYLTLGATQGRQHRRFDPLFYGAAYPQAATAVASGLYPSLFAHFIEQGQGQGQGLQPCP